MKIITKELDLKLEENRKKILFDYHNDTITKMDVVAHLFHPFSNWDWYLIGYSMEDENNKDYIFTLTKGNYIEFGDIYLPELLEVKTMGLSIERSRFFKPIDSNKLYKQLIEGEKR